MIDNYITPRIILFCRTHNDIKGNDKSQHRAAEEKGENFEFSDEFLKVGINSSNN